MLIDQDRSKKFQPKYIGPFTVVRRTRNGNYVLRDETGEYLDRHVPPDQLKLISKVPRPGKDAVYVVKKIHTHRGVPGQLEYYVEWDGYRTKTWESEANMINDVLVTDYWKSLEQNPLSSS
jgi:hypothetical protein